MTGEETGVSDLEDRVIYTLIWKTWERTRGWQCRLKVWSNAIQVNRKITLYKFPLKMLSLHLLKQLLFWYWMRIVTDRVLLLCVWFLLDKEDWSAFLNVFTLKWFLFFFPLISFLAQNFVGSWPKCLTPWCLDHSFPKSFLDTENSYLKYESLQGDHMPHHCGMCYIVAFTLLMVSMTQCAHKIYMWG